MNYVGFGRFWEASVGKPEILTNASVKSRETG